MKQVVYHIVATQLHTAPFSYIAMNFESCLLSMADCYGWDCRVFPKCLDTELFL
jgi:hypothetical protein